MLTITYHASHEQFPPGELRELAVLAEAAGFDGIFSSDHINPWTPEQGHSGFIWSWLGAALQATRQVPFSAITVPGGGRYPPAVIAQAIGTLGEMFPGRLPWIALGSGEALNERVVNADWPAKPERNARLLESFQVIRELLAGNTVTRTGKTYSRSARVWSRPASPAGLMIAALSKETARWAGAWADGLLTTAADIDDLAAIAQAFQSTGKGKPMHAKVDVSWAPSDAQALAQAHEQWRVHSLPRASLAEFSTPEEFAVASRDVDAERVRQAVAVSADLGQHIEWLKQRASLGFRSLDVHNVGGNQKEFIAAFGAAVLPELRRYA